MVKLAEHAQTTETDSDSGTAPAAAAAAAVAVAVAIAVAVAAAIRTAASSAHTPSPAAPAALTARPASDFMDYDQVWKSIPPQKVLFLNDAHGSMSQALLCELQSCGHEVFVHIVDKCECAARFAPFPHCQIGLSEFPSIHHPSIHPSIHQASQPASQPASHHQPASVILCVQGVGRPKGRDAASKYMLDVYKLHKPDLVMCPFLTAFVPEELYNKSVVAVFHPGPAGESTELMLQNGVGREQADKSVACAREGVH
eukprot:365587-Chlamydomonas_euryale.AAC.2